MQAIKPNRLQSYTHLHGSKSHWTQWAYFWLDTHRIVLLVLLSEQNNLRMLQLSLCCMQCFHSIPYVLSWNYSNGGALHSGRKSCPFGFNSDSSRTMHRMDNSQLLKPALLKHLFPSHPHSICILKMGNVHLKRTQVLFFFTWRGRKNGVRVGGLGSLLLRTRESVTFTEWLIS